MTTAALSQARYRGRSDADVVDAASPTWIANENTNWTQSTNTPFRVRFLIQETAGGNPASHTVKLQYQRNALGFNDVTASSSVVKASASASSSADETSIATSRLTGTGTYVAGRYDSSGAVSTSVDIGSSGRTEYEFGVQLDGATVNPGDTVNLKVVALSGTAITITQQPTITVRAKLTPSLFTNSSTFHTPTVQSVGLSAGTYNITVRAFDGQLFRTKGVTVTVSSTTFYSTYLSMGQY